MSDEPRDANDGQRVAAMGEVMAGLRRWKTVVQRQMDAYGFSAAEQRLAWTLFEVQTNRDVGDALGLSLQTVKNHLTSMMKKTSTTNRLALVLALLQLADEAAPEPAARPRRRRSTT